MNTDWERTAAAGAGEAQGTQKGETGNLPRRARRICDGVGVAWL